MPYISCVDWRRFQHYDPAKRQPPWIKSYLELLDDDDYLSLTTRQRGLLHGIWLAYAASRSVLGSSPARLGRILGDPSVRARDIEALCDAGFLRIVASKALAEGYQGASARARPAEAETEVEAEKSSTPRAVPLPQPEAKTTGGGHGGGAEDERNSRPNIEPDDSMGSLDPADELMRVKFGGEA